jgi:hypothetical protein
MFNYNLFLQRLSNSKTYQESFIKNEIAKRLLTRLDYIKILPKNILIDGYIDNNLHQIIKDRFPNSNISFKKEGINYDLIISNTVIHLTDNINTKLHDYYTLLSTDGMLMFSTFGDKSFKTLNKCFKHIDSTPHTNSMIGLLTWGDSLQNSDFKTPAIESDIIKFTYEKTSKLFNDVRDLSEPLADTKMSTSLIGRNKWSQIIRYLEENIVLEIEALYGHALRKESPTQNMSSKQNRISLDELKKQISDFKNN